MDATKIELNQSQSYVLNSFAEAAKHVRQQLEFVELSATMVKQAMMDGETLSTSFGKNNLSEAISRYNAVEDLAATVLLNSDLEFPQVEALLKLAREVDPNGISGKHFFQTKR